jgi:hypothetical protein
MAAFEEFGVAVVPETVTALPPIQRSRFTIFEGDRMHSTAAPPHAFD